MSRRPLPARRPARRRLELPAAMLLGLLCCVAASLRPVPALAAPRAEPAPASAGGLGRAARTEVLLPGPLLATAVAHRADGSTALAVLVGPPEPPEESNEDDAGDRPSEEEASDKADDEAPRPRSLLLVDPVTGEITLLAAGLPDSAHGVVALARDGASDLLIVATGEGPRTVDPDRADRPATGTFTDHLTGSSTDSGGTAATPGSPGEATGLARAAVVYPGGLDADPRQPVALARTGALTLVTAAGGAPVPLATFPLPKRAERKRWGVHISSPPVHPVGSGSDGRTAAEAAPLCWAVGPEAYGKRRLRTLLDCLGQGGAADGEAPEPVEAWSLLPDRETVTKTLYTRSGGRPVLVVLTRQKLGLFVKQRLRLFPLAASRNRVGAAPALAAETSCPIWHGSSLGFADTDGDGRDDLYLVCQKGLVDQELRLEIYRSVGGGRFDQRVRDVELDGEYSSWDFGHDWTGDGLPDLLAVHDGAIELHPGTGSRRHPVEHRPVESLALGPTGDDEEGSLDVVATSGDGGATEVGFELGGPRILGTVDLTGDGQPELVVYRRGRPGGQLVIVSPPTGRG